MLWTIQSISEQIYDKHRSCNLKLDRDLSPGDCHAQQGVVASAGIFVASFLYSSDLVGLMVRHLPQEQHT